MENKNNDVTKNNSSDPVIVTVPVKYSPEEIKVRSELIRACTSARDERERPHEEFDGMTYSQYYDTNKRADLSYIPPKKNRDDKRIVTGITREKDSTLLSSLLAYNFKADITAYDDSEMIFPQLGNNMEDLIIKSRELEQWEKLRPLLYRELISQGDVFWEDIWECVYTPEYKNEGNWKPGDKIDKATFKKSLVPTKFERAAVKLHPGKNVYVSNFYEMDHKKQATVFTYEVIDRSVAESLYGTWDRWECVPQEVENIIGGIDTTTGVYKDWNLLAVNKNQVGVLKIQQKFANRYMIMLNGVMMLPHNFPLSEISPDGECTIKHNTLEGIVGCAYGKGQPAKTKVDQAVHDEFLKLLIIGEEQSRKPPMGTRSKRVFGSEIFSAGKINNNIKEGDLFSILPPNSGLNNADFSMFNLIKEQIEGKSINATFSGERPQGPATAFQLNQEKQQQLLKLGLNFDAIKSLEKELCWARIGNLIMHYSKPIDRKANLEDKTIEDIYTQFSMESTLPDGKKGIKIFKFTDKEFPTIDNQKKEEKELSDYYQKPTNIIYFNGPGFMKFLKYRWVINITPTQDTNDMIEREVFVNSIETAQRIFGPESLNYEYLKERFALNSKEDPSKFFLEDGGAGVMNQLASGMVGAQNGGSGGSPVASGMGNVIKAPQINPVR